MILAPSSKDLNLVASKKKKNKKRNEKKDEILKRKTGDSRKNREGIKGKSPLGGKERERESGLESLQKCDRDEWKSAT